MMNIRLNNIIKNNGGLKELIKMDLNELKGIKGMTMSCLREIVLLQNNINLLLLPHNVDLLKEYIKEEK